MARHPDTEVKFTSDNAAKSSRGLEPIKQIKIRASVGRGDFTESATSQTFAASEAIPDNAVIMGVAKKVRQLADDGDAISSALLTSGASGNGDGYVDDQDILTGSGSTGYTREDPSGPGDGVAASAFPQALASGFTPEMTVTADVDVDTLTEGDFEVTYFFFAPTDPDA